MQWLAIVTRICDEKHDGAKIISDDLRDKLEQMAWMTTENSAAREALKYVEGFYKERM